MPFAPRARHVVLLQEGRKPYRCHQILHLLLQRGEGGSITCVALSELLYERHLYHTGWRKREILILEWREIQGDVIRLRPEIAKNKDGRVIILWWARSRILLPEGRSSV